MFEVFHTETVQDKAFHRYRLDGLDYWAHKVGWEYHVESADEHGEKLNWSFQHRHLTSGWVEKNLELPGAIVEHLKKQNWVCPMLREGERWDLD